MDGIVFIFLGAPLIEKTHGNLHLAALMNGITAAVVGVIASLVLFFLGTCIGRKAGKADLNGRLC